MARYSSAYSDFIVRLKEVDKVASTARRYERMKPIGSQSSTVSALCRGGIVLLSSHIEGYITDINELILERILSKNIRISRLPDAFLYYHSRDILDEIADTTDPEAISKKVKNLFTRDSHIWDDGDFFTSQLDHKRFMKGFRTPKPKNIYTLLRRYGHQTVKSDIQQSLRGQFILHEANLENTVDSRNKIAHGDQSITKTPDDLRRLNGSVKTFCREIDKSICNWFRRKQCTLR